MAAFAGWLGVAAWNTARIAFAPLGAGGVGVRLGHLAVDLGHTLAIGFLVGGAVAAYVRLPRRWPALDYVAVTLAAVALSQAVLVPDLEGAVERWTGGAGGTWLVRSAAMAVGLSIPGAFAAGRLAARYGFRRVPVALALLLIAFNDRILINGYPGAHVLMATCGATLLGTALAGFPVRFLPGRGSLGPKLLVPAALVGCVASFVVPAPSRVRVELSERDTALLAPWLGTFAASETVAGVEIPKELAVWYRSRRNRPDIPPSAFRPLPENPIVVLITIDALRMELLEPKHRQIAPNLQEIRRHGVFFSQARSSGSDTRFSLATLFTGRHMSMLKWNYRSRGRPTLERERSPRLPELLAREGVISVTGVSLPNMLVPRIGIVRGFSEQFIKDDTDDLPGTVEVVNHAIERLRRHGSEPLFYYAHLIDPHQPYRTHKKRAKTKYEAYLLEVEFVDAALGRLRRAIRELGLAERTALIVSSDHGEGFGEHGLYYHNKALYDVMVHVPLMIEIPGVAPRTIDHHVSLMDVGATVLDLFGVPVPGYWVSESLVPMLTGEVDETHRPILMERPREQAVLFRDGMKVMLRRGLEEIYDVHADPEELDNLRDELGAEGDRLVALARAYVGAHGGKVAPKSR